MDSIKFRCLDPRLAPRRTKLDIPGWAGQREPRATGSHEQAWHCQPFSEGAQYGFEVFYPYSNELRVSKKNGELDFEGDFGPPSEDGINWPPFRSFGKDYFTYQILLDMKVPEGFALRTEPHPRFYTDASGTVPIAVPALVRRWWPMLSFVVFKAPIEGHTHIFRPGEPMLQILVIPEENDLQLQEMPAEEAAEREVHYRRIHASRATLGKETEWTSASDTVFDGTYRHLARAMKTKPRS